MHNPAGRFFIFIGACTRYIYGTLWRTIAQKPKFRFDEYLNGPDNPDYYDQMGHKLNNLLIGMIIFLLLMTYLVL